MIWMAGPPPAPATGESWPDLLLFFSFYAALVLLLGLWSRWLARGVATENFNRSLRRFNQVMFGAKLMVPAWFTVGVWELGWGVLVADWGQTLYRSVAGLLIGTAPAFAAWMGLWWSQYPAERALREQNLLLDFDSDLPLYQPPTFGVYFLSKLRLEVLFTLLPVAMIVLVRDGLAFLAVEFFTTPSNPEVPTPVEMTSLVLSAAIVFVFAPVLLRRILKTRTMPDSPLRQRLEHLCQRAGVKYRQLLIWDTHHHVGNAAVMGVVPQLRYVLMSDVLIERMEDEEIEAVFAHELGHIVHHHMTWYAIFFLVLTLGAYAACSLLNPYVQQLSTSSATGLALVGGMASFLLLFGALSRRCERQADVFAARTMERLNADVPLASEAIVVARQLVTVGAGPLIAPTEINQTPVGRHGAKLFASALRRVATINNIPITPRGKARPGLFNRIAHWSDGVIEFANNWLHGSIPSRMQYLQDLSADPRYTGHFDRSMFWLYCSLLLALFTSVVFSVLQTL